MVAYDDIWAMTYLERRVRAWWRRNGATAADLLLAAEHDFSPLVERSPQKFDGDPMSGSAQGGRRSVRTNGSAGLSAIDRGAYKMAADADGRIVVLPQGEFFQTAASIRWMCSIRALSLFLAFESLSLLAGSLEPVFEYASGSSNSNFAPHDLGRYPRADGQVLCCRRRQEDGREPDASGGIYSEA